MLRPDADMNMAESSGGSRSVKTAYTAAWPGKVCVSSSLCSLYMMLPCLKAQQREALGRAVCGTFVVRLQTAQKSSGFQHARASLNAFPLPEQNLSPVPWLQYVGQRLDWTKVVTRGALRAKIAFKSKPVTYRFHQWQTQHSATSHFKTKPLI